MLYNIYISTLVRIYYSFRKYIFYVGDELLDFATPVVHSNYRPLAVQNRGQRTAYSLVKE
jgi:hypothetical protein